MVNETENAVEEQENVQYEVEDASWTPPVDEDKSEETRTIVQDSEGD